jgi:hypothetical protein
MERYNEINVVLMLAHTASILQPVDKVVISTFRVLLFKKYIT